jgi:hypothetical protein
MTAQLIQILPADFAPTSKVWIYESNRPLFENEVLEMNEQLHNFYSQWLSHGAPVKGWAQVIFNKFIIVLADEDATHVGGCSTDSMVRVVKSFERQYQLNLFDRMNISFFVNNKVEPLPMNQVSYALQKGYIETDTILFNNSVTTKAALLENWMVPLNKSWLWDRIVKHAIE